MPKTIGDDVKEMLRWIWEMTTWRNIAINIILTAMLIGAAVLCVGVIVISIEGYNYIRSLYQQADAGAKLSAIMALLCVFLGVGLSYLFGKLKKSIIDKPVRKDKK